MIKGFDVQYEKKPWGVEELLIAHTDHYTGKILKYKVGYPGPLQYHEKKDETFYLYAGKAKVRYVDNDGVLREDIMYPGEAIHVPPGSVHQVEPIIDCIFFEASTPVFNDRVNVEDQYANSV